MSDSMQTPNRLRQIRSFVLREGRLTAGQQRALDELWPSKGLDPQQPLDPQAVFGRQAPLVVEIGFGMGQSLVQMAQAAPDQDFIGIEVHTPGVGACLMAMQQAQLSNLRLYRHDAVEVLKHCIAADSLSAVQIYFPDPWHKKKHHKRRLIQPALVELLVQRLAVGGHIHLATDWQHYAEHMLEVLKAQPELQNQSPTGDYLPRPDNRPLTKFEQRGHRLGHGVWDLLFSKQKT